MKLLRLGADAWAAGAVEPLSDSPWGLGDFSTVTSSLIASELAMPPPIPERLAQVPVFGALAQLSRRRGPRDGECR